MRNEKEQDIQKAILDLLAYKGFVAVKYHSTVGVAREGKYVPIKTGTKGTADILACSPDGRFWAIEVKRKGNKPTPEQLAFIERIRSCGGVAFVAFSVDDVVTKIQAVADCLVPAPRHENSGATAQ